MTRSDWTRRLDLDARARTARLAFLELHAADRAELRALSEVLSPQIDALVDRWHAFLLERPETRDLLSRGRVQEHLRVAQAAYFRTLLAGPYDETYFDDRLRIGFIHQRVGLEPVWYTASYRKFQSLVRETLLAGGYPVERVTRWMEVLEKVVYLDMELALDAYFHSQSEEILEANRALRDMTRKLERGNRELRREFERAQEAARVKEAFLSQISHELRTPLNAVLGFADLLADGIEGPVTPEQARSLGKIRSHGERLLRLIEQMIDAAKMAAAGLAAPRAFDPGPLARDLAATARGAAEGAGLRFTTSGPERLPLVWGDPEGFVLALGHVLENAVKFTREGTVELRAEHLAEVVRWTVADSGPGIPPADRDRIFEPFHQVDAGDTRTATGLGMGLTLARQALVRMGGTLELVDTGEGGSTFALELPVAPDDADPGG